MHDESEPDDPPDTYDAQEQTRRQVLRRIYERRDAPGGIVVGRDLAYDLGLTREETFRILEFLAGRGMIDYLGAGPMVRLTERGTALVEAWDDLEPGG